MRGIIATAALTALIAGSSAFALAAPGHASRTLRPATAANKDVLVKSPDVAEWTATLIHDGGNHSAAQGHSVRSFAARILRRTSTIAADLTRNALRFLGTPYVFGGTSPSGFDCSGFVQHVFAMLGMHIPRTADAQYYAGRPVKGNLKPGDLVFFQTYAPGPSHVGIYLGDDKFVSAASEGVMISSLSNSYWRAHYIGAKTLIASQ